MFISLKMSKSVINCCVIAVFVGFFTGCGEQERAAELYTDAIILNQTESKAEAIEKLKSAIELNQEFSMAHSLLGDIYFETGQYEDSEQAYEKATELNEYSFNDFFNLGRVRQVLKKFKEAVKAYARACQLDPENLPAHINTAKCYFELKDDDTDAMENALEYGILARQIDPNAGEVEKLLGDIYQAQKDNILAIESYKRALEIEGNDPDIMISLAVSYLRGKQNESAKEVLEAVLEENNQNSLAYRYLGYYYIRTNDFDNALENYLMATQFNNQDWNSHKGLGVAYMLRAINNEDDEAREMAIDHWKTSLSINPRQEKLRKLLKKYSI